MNENAKRAFDKKFSEVKAEESKLAKLKNLRALAVQKHEDKRRKVARDYDERKSKALKKINDEKVSDLHGQDETISALAANIELQKRALLELAKESTMTPAETATVVPLPRFSGTVGATNGVAVH